MASRHKPGALMVEILSALGSGVRRLFRQNVALGWVGELVRHDRKTGTVTLANARPLHAGLCVGSPDIVGWHVYVIQPEDVGRKIAVFSGVEVKEGQGRLSLEQSAFLRTLAKQGGIAIEGRAVDQVRTAFETWRPPEGEL